MKTKKYKKMTHGILIGVLVVPLFLAPYGTIVYGDESTEPNITSETSEIVSESLLDLEQTIETTIQSETIESTDRESEIKQSVETENTETESSVNIETTDDENNIELASSDNTAPVIESIEVSPEEVRVGDEIKVIVKASDDLSGVRAVNVYFKSPTNSRKKTISLKENRTTGFWEGTNVIQEYDESGEWSFDYLGVHDVIGNSKLYYAKDFDKDLNFVVSNQAGDNTAPVIESIEVSPKEVKVGDEIKVVVKASDDLSGVRAVNVYFKSPTNSRKKTISLKENRTTGFWEGTNVIQEYDESGEWSFDYLGVHDVIGNSKLYYAKDFDKNLNFVVYNQVGDNTAPVIESIEVSPKEVRVGDEIKVVVKARDDLSGVRAVNVYFKSPTDSRKKTISLKENRTTGFWEGTNIIQEYDESGEWIFDYLGVHDVIGNSKLYYGKDFDKDLNFLVKAYNEDGSEIIPEELPYHIVHSNASWSNKTIEKDVYVGPDAVLTINSNVKITGNVYVYGAIRSYGGLTITGKLAARQINYGGGTTVYQGSVRFMGGSHSISSIEVSNSAYPVPLDVDFEILENKELVVSGRTLPILDVFVDGNKAEVDSKGFFTIQLANYKNTVTVVARDVFGSDNIEKLKLGLEETLREEKIETVPFITERKEDPTLKKGKQVVDQVGVAGKKTITYEVKYVNEVEVSRKILSEVVNKEPVTEIIRVGTKEDVIAFVKEETKEVIPYETITKKDDTLFKGEKVTKQKGKNGERTIIHEVKYVNEEETGRTLISDKVTTKATPEIVLIGTKEVKVGWTFTNNKWYYFSQDKVKAVGWQKIDQKWYYFDQSGAMQTGWKLINTKWYYMTSSGIMQTSWQKIGGEWYHFKPSGEMQTGWQLINNKWYYMTSSGKMMTGWQKQNDIWYYLSSSGAMQIGWQRINGIWYYMTSGGNMVTGWLDYRGNRYYLNPHGSMQVGWKLLEDKWYYFETSGAMVTGERVINGIAYTFSTNGEML